MRKADLVKNHTAFDEALARYRAFMERVVQGETVTATAAERQDVSESVLLRLCANWERFVDEHLVDCVNVDHSGLNAFLGVSIPRHPTKNLCRAVLYGGGFKDFRSYGDLKGFTKRILPDASNPFLVVTKAHADRMDETYKIRNYLSHYSAVARRSLAHLYRQGYQLARFEEPGRFLLAHGGQRLWTYIAAFEGASNDMKAWY